MKLPPNWKAEQVGYGLVISGDKAAIRIDTDGVGGNEGSTSAPVNYHTHRCRTNKVEVADGTFL